MLLIYECMENISSYKKAIECTLSENESSVNVILKELLIYMFVWLCSPLHQITH